MSDQQGWSYEQYYATIRVGDINGDGKADVCGRGIAGMLCWLSNGGSFQAMFNAVPWSNAESWNNRIYYDEYLSNHLIMLTSISHSSYLCFRYFLFRIHYIHKLRNQ